MLGSTAALRSILLALAVTSFTTLPAPAQLRTNETTGRGPVVDQSRPMSREDRLLRNGFSPADYNSLNPATDICTLGNTASAPQECEQVRFLQPKGSIY